MLVQLMRLEAETVTNRARGDALMTAPRQDTARDSRWINALPFAAVFVAQLAHLAEHIFVKVFGAPLIGAAANSELTHLAFNTAIALASVFLVVNFRYNPWVYPLTMLAVFHVVEHVYIYGHHLSTGIVDGPGLLGVGGAIGLIPLLRADLHNVYNGFEMIFIVLGLSFEIEDAQ